MKKIGKRAKAAFLLLLAFCIALSVFYINLGINGGQWALAPYNRHIYKDGLLQNTGSILDRDGAVLAKTENNKRIYNENSTIRKSLLHIVGDNSGYFNGIQKNYASALAGYSFINGIHTLSEWNAVPSMKLTISSELNKKIANAFSGKKGAVIVYNYSNGEVIASLSAPNYDPLNVPSNLNSEKYEGIYVNRALNGMYPPGSTFKIITAISALENINNVNELKFNCEGKCQIEDGGEIICNGKHGEIDFKEGLKVSCNVVYAQLAIKLGAKNLKNTAEKFGFNNSGEISKLSFNGGYYNTDNAKLTDLGWSGIGQWTVLTSPFTMMKLSGVIANNGSFVEPRLIKSVNNAVGIPTIINLPIKKSVISANTANELKEMMKLSATYSFGENLVEKYSLRCKTGTAEVEKGAPHSWLTGFLDNKKTPYAFAIIIENGGGAATATRYILNTLLKSLTEL